MKVIILTATLGAGHNHVAFNLEEEFKNKGHDVKVVDLFKHKGFLQWLFGSFGFTAMSKVPTFANYFYDRSIKSDKSIFDWAIKKIKKEMLATINQFQPDIIVSTHVAGRLFAKKFENQIKNKFLNYFVVTDYELPPGLKNFEQNEYVVVPSKDFKINLAKKGFNSKNILPFGIPIKTKFYQPTNKQDALKALGLKLGQGKKVVLVSGGGKGHGKILKIIKELIKYNDLIIISVAGNNKKLKSKVDRLAKNKQNLISYGFTHQMDSLMAVSDLIIGKTGGITATEAIAKRVPLLGVGNMSKPEQSNLLYLSKHNMAAKVKSAKNLYQVINDINVDLIKENYTTYLNKNSAKNIVEHASKIFEDKQN